MELKTFRIDSIEAEGLIVNPAQWPDSIGVQGRSPDRDDPVRYTLYDLRSGREGCKVTVNGRDTSRWELILWFSVTKNPRADIVINDEQYGHVAEARFTG